MTDIMHGYCLSPLFSVARMRMIMIPYPAQLLETTYKLQHTTVSYFTLPYSTLLYPLGSAKVPYSYSYSYLYLTLLSNVKFQISNFKYQLLEN